MSAVLFHDTRCLLGEGPLWSGDRLYFFDILASRLHSLTADGRDLTTWDMGAMASAAARLTDGALLVATETGLVRFDPQTGRQEALVALEADRPDTRSNDGRADRHGGFWIGTMGKAAEAGAGTIYRFYEGAVHKLRSAITIPNAICFSPDGRTAYFADSAERIIYRWALDDAGWPIGEPAPFFALTEQMAGAPDGAIVDAEGTLWCAIWGGRKILGLAGDGKVQGEIAVPASRPCCPAFGPDGRIFITTAREGMSEAELLAEPTAGGVFVAETTLQPVPEPEIALT